jgi:membrane protein
VTGSPKDAVLKNGGLILSAGAGFFRHNCFNLAAAVAFYSILSLIPFFFVVVSLAGRLVGSSKPVMDSIDRLLADAIPFYSDLLMNEVTKISLGSGFYGLIGLLFILWTGSLIFDSLEYAFNRVFESPRRRPYLRTKLMGLAVFPAGGFLLTLVFFLSALLGMAESLPVAEYLPFLGRFQTTAIEVALASIPHLFLFAVLVLAFRIVPAIRVSYGQACLGAAISTLGWVVLKLVFGLVIIPNPNYGVVYGSLKAMIILILWIFFAVCLVLFSAELIAARKRISSREVLRA